MNTFDTQRHNRSMGPLLRDGHPVFPVVARRARARTATRALAPLLALAGGLALAPARAGAQAQPAAPVMLAVSPNPEGVVSLQATASAQAARDWMTVVFSTTKEGTDAAAVQSQLKQALDAALAEARRVANPGDRVKSAEVRVQGGGFSLQPRYGQKGTMTGWTGTTSMTVEGRDMGAIAQLVGRVGTLAIARLDYALSPEARAEAEGRASAEAIGRYRAKAGEVASLFGYARWTVREVNVQADQQQPTPPRFAMKAMAMSSGDGAPLPVEAGEGNVTVTVSGTIQLAK